jgi:hypothetical protein
MHPLAPMFVNMGTLPMANVSLALAQPRPGNQYGANQTACEHLKRWSADVMPLVE